MPKSIWKTIGRCAIIIIENGGVAMKNNRDDFSAHTKELLAKRVGYRCSNPSCRKLTCGANDDTQSFTNIGVAAHITAAAIGGPRYDAGLTPDERKDFDNGIWLCQSCAKLIDSDELHYPVSLLHKWKQLAEETTTLELATSSPAQSVEQDVELIRFYVQCLDRPAFQDRISQEGRMEDFDKALEDTIVALNTGTLRTRDGDIIKKAEGKSSLQNPDWREKLYTIVDILTVMRRRLSIAKNEKAYSYHGSGYDGFYCFYDRELEEWFDCSREEILKIISSICKEIGLHPLHFSKHHYRYRGF